jgi:predicted amidohydrolase YtcJ
VEKLDLIIKGNIITVTNHQPRAEVIGVKDEKIVYVGSLRGFEETGGMAADVLDLTSKTICPDSSTATHIRW